jgi:polyhydroxyalkanoate synthase
MRDASAWEPITALAETTGGPWVKWCRAPIDVTLDACRRVPFALNDELRRTQGRVLGAFGLDPSECPHRIVASGPFWRLREYGGQGTQRLLVVAAPIKRPYIWDLAPSASAIRYCVQRGLQVGLVEWLPASATVGNNGIAEYTAAISECIAMLPGRCSEARPFVIGHSLGGTLAAVYGAMASDAIRGLVLLSAPLCFQAASSHFRDALVSLVPRDMSDTAPCPGSLLSHMSALASPHTLYVLVVETDRCRAQPHQPSCTV